MPRQIMGDSSDFQRGPDTSTSAPKITLGSNGFVSFVGVPACDFNGKIDH
jgi:hypothetical protein